jgi:beta-lactamase regulating signal transducer with metallopeptidase domain/dipeptidyl aminopeptidase/acylaminoacyl peptidase
MIGQINRIAEIWWSWMWPMFWQVSLLIAFLGVADYFLRRHLWPQIRYAMWLLVLVKLLLPPTFVLPTGIVSRLHPPTDRPVAKPYDGNLASYTLAIEEGFDQQGRGPKGYAEPRENPAPMESTAETSPGMTTPRGVSAHPSWKAIAMAGWLVGGVVLTVWLAAGYARLSRIHCSQGSKGHVPESFTRLLAATAQRLRLRRLPRVVVSQGVESPAVFGVLRPVLLLPARGTEDLSPREAEHILLHELAHLKRRDLQVHAFCIALQVIYWFNPLLYLVRRQLQHLRELCCDATVAAILKEGTKDYCQTLLETAEWLLRKPRARGIGFLGLVENPSRLLARLQWLQKGPSRHPRLRRATALLVGGLLFAFLLPMAQAKKSTESPAKAGSVDSPSTESPSASSLSQPALSPGEKTGAAPAKDAPITPQATGAGATEKAPPAAESDTVVDPKTGLTFTVAKRISGESDVVFNNDRLRLSPNGKFLLYRGQVVPLDGGKPFKLEALHGTEYAVWSPDGKLIAYWDKAVVWLLPVAPETGQPTGPARKLFDEQLNWSECEVVWSRDSQWIFFAGDYHGYQHRIISVQDGRLMQPPDYTRFSLRSPDQKSLAYFKPQDGVWTAPVEGGASRLVAGHHGDRGPQSSRVPLWWSPDGQWLLCARGYPGNNYNDLRFVRLADHQEVVLRFPGQGVVYPLGISPDGKKLHFHRSSQNWRDVFKVAPLRGGGLTELSFARGVHLNRASLSSPDGQRWFFMVYRAGPEGKPGTYVPYVAASTTADPVEVKLPEEVKRERATNYWTADRWRLSPDGKRLFRRDQYNTTRGEYFSDLYVIPISLEKAESTGPATLIFKEWQGGTSEMAWSPDSSRLVIPAWAKGGADLWVVPADGSPAKQLTQSPEEEQQQPKWSPDGKYIAYCTVSAGQVHLYTIPAEGGAPKRLWTESGEGLPCFTWFPDSKEIGVESGDTLLAVAIADGTVRPFLKLADAGLTWLWWLHWSPDGQTLALLGGDDNENNRTALFRASDKEIEMLPPDPDWKPRMGWTGDSQALFYVAEGFEKVRPAGLIYEVDLMEAWTRAKNDAAGVPSPAGASPIAKPEAPPLVNGEFRDDFESGDTKYWTFQDESSTYDHVREVQNGELVLENARAVLGLPEWTNYVVTVKMCIKRDGVVPKSSMFAGVGFRKGECGEYCLSAVPAQKCLWLGIRYPGADQWYRTASLAEPPYDFVLDKWYTIQVEVKGPHIGVRVDGQPIIDLNDENCSQGAVTLIASLHNRVHFDDFSVRLLP